MRSGRLLLLAAGLLAACGTDSTSPPAGPLSLHLAPVDSGYDFSVFVTAPPGDQSRLIVVQRGGRILLRKNGVRQDSAFLNLTSRTTPATGEYGTYSLAFHPQYAANHRLFVYYVPANGNGRLSEFTATPDGDHADINSEQVIIELPQDPAAVLYGGTVAFGPDGYLYLAFGDTAEGRNTASLPSSPAQDSTSLHGKMIRIDVDQGAPYTVPADNPFVNRPGWLPEIWDLGFRNPWRWSFDRATGDLYIADVQEDTREEIDYEPMGTGGRNYGWPVMESTLCYRPLVGCSMTGLVPPVFGYPHHPACSVTGGYVYRGAAIPELRGTYFYGDYCAGWVRSFRLAGGVPVIEYDPLQAPLINDNVVSFGEDAAGEIYVVMASGRIYRIEGER